MEQGSAQLADLGKNHMDNERKESTAETGKRLPQSLRLVLMGRDRQWSPDVCGCFNHALVFFYYANIYA